MGATARLPPVDSARSYARLLSQSHTSRTLQEELVVSDDDADVLDGLVDKRAKAYSFGLGKRAKAYSFGLGKRAKAYSFGLGKRAKAYSFGLGKRLPGGERRYAFGLGKRPDADLDEQLESDETWQSQDSVVGKRELAPQELKEVADEHQHSDAASGGHAATRTKRAAPLQYSFGLGKRFDDEEEDADELLGEDAFGRSARAKQYGFGLGKRFMLRQYDAASAKRGPRQYGFGLGRRSMQYNFGIGKRSGTSEDSATPSPADR